MSRLRERIRAAAVLFGRKVMVSLAIATFGAILLSLVELGIALFLQLFLSSLGLLAVEVPVPFDLARRLASPQQVAIALVVIAVVRLLSQVLVGQASTVALETVSERLRLLAVYELLLHPRRPYVPASRLMTQLGEHFGKAGTFAFGFASLVGSAIQVVVLTLILFFTAWRESSVAFVGLLLVGVLVLRIQRRSRRFAQLVPEQLESVARGLERVARNMFLVRALRTERLEHGRFRRSIDAYAHHSIVAGLWGNVATATAPFAGTLLIVVVVIVSQRVFFTQGLVLLSFLYLFVRFVQALASSVYQLSLCNQYSPQFLACVDYARRVGLEHVGSATGGDAERAGEAPAPITRAPTIQFDAVSFAYSTEASAVFEQLSFEVAAGEQFAVVGPSGAGKSTMLSLLLGLLQPDRGNVRIDGVSPRDYFETGPVVGYVGAEAYLIAGTLRDNLVYGLRAEVDDAALWRALEAARLAEAVRALPSGLDHPLREDGAGLSAGQKQRLCLARALLGSPGLLVLDEASANLDTDTETELASMLSTLKGRVTVLVVSHRPGLLVHADRVLQLQPGRAAGASVAPPR